MSANLFDFDDCILLISARSPFARRVRAAFIESGLRFQINVTDVFHPTEELRRANPLARVPAVILRDGRTLIESQWILDAFYEGSGSQLWPEASENPKERFELLKWSGLMVGLCDRIVEWFLESIKTDSRRDPDIDSDFALIQKDVLVRTEEVLAGRTWITGGQNLTQADIDAGCALSYLKFRYSKDALKNYKECEAYLARIEQRAAFQQTTPPA